MAERTIPAADYSRGVHDLPAIELDARDTACRVTFTPWADRDTKAKMKVRLSIDGGVTYCPNPNGETEWPWGIFPVAWEVGGDQVVQEAIAIIPLPAAASRHIKLELEAVDPVRTEIKLGSA